MKNTLTKTQLSKMTKPELVAMIETLTGKALPDTLKASTKPDLINAIQFIQKRTETTENKEEATMTTETTKTEATETPVEETTEETTIPTEFITLMSILENLGIQYKYSGRRIKTDLVMYCRRKNAVRAYMKKRSFDYVRQHDSKQYKAYVDVALDSRADSVIRDLHRH